jgi:diguanylate cyclase (GGDEF)-like protein
MGMVLFSSHRIQWAALLVFLSFLAALVAGALSFERHKLLHAESEHLAAQARVVDKNITRQLVAVNAALASVLRDLVYLEAENADPKVLHRHLQSLSDAMPGVRTLSLLDGEANVVASNREDLVGRNFAYREYVQAVLQRPAPESLYLSRPFRTVLNVYSMNLVRVQLDGRGDVRRIAAATLDPEFFEILLASVLYADDMWTAMAHEGGLLTVHQPSRPELLGADLNQPGSFFSRHIASGLMATVLDGRVQTTGQSALMAQRTIQPESLKMDGRMVVAVARHPAKVLAGWRSMAMVGGAVWGVLSVVAMTGLWFFQRHRTQVLKLLQEKELLRQKAETEIRNLAFYDPLTQLPNRRLLMDRLQQVQVTSARLGWCSALFFIDLDDFKQLNDTHGHDQGDRLLREVAQRLRACVQDEDTVARLGGDEFVVMLPELSEDVREAVSKAESVASKVLGALSEEYPLADLRYRCSASIGITLFGNKTEPLGDILKRADRAMYAAKAAGRNTFRLAGE